MYRPLHIISFDVPYPANYGGVIDIFYKIKTLSELGVPIHLHCFEYGRQQASELEKYCARVSYYPRNRHFLRSLNLVPYIINSRRSEPLIRNLLLDDHPILFEGLHTCYYLDDKRLENRFKMVRTHNIEQDYYSGLAQAEPNFLRKLYFYSASIKLRFFEKVLHSAQLIFPISLSDTAYFSSRFKKVSYLPPFHANEEVSILPGSGNYVLYHGNLGVKENEKAAIFLLNNVFNDREINFVIAGNDPSPRLRRCIKKYPHVTLRSDLGDEEINELIMQAHVNILPTFQATGIKLKLLNALFSGRHCLVNTFMVEGTGLEDLCVPAETPGDFKCALDKLMVKPFEEKDIRERAAYLCKHFDRKKNAKKIITSLQEDHATV